MGFFLPDNKSSASFASNTSIINQSMTNMVNSTSNSTTVHNFNVQNNSVKVIAPPGYTYATYGPLVKGCTVMNKQTMNATQKVSVSLDVSSTKNLQTQISNALKTANDTAIKQKAAFLQTANNESSTATTVNEAISNLVSKNINDSVTNSLTTLLNNAQNNVVELVGPVECTKENPTLSANIQELLSSQIVDTITKALTGTTISEITSTKSDIKNKTSSDQEGEGISGAISAVFSGFTGLVSGLFDGVTGPFKWIIIAIVAAIIIGGLVAIFKKPSPPEASVAAAFGRMLFGGRKSRFGRRR